MPVFTVVGREAFPKVLVAKNTIEEVVESSIRKLKLPQGSYKLILEKNGALIDEDDLLAALQPESELVILPEDEDWHGRGGTPTFTPVTPIITERPPGVTPSTRKTPRSSDICVPWDSLACVQEEFEGDSPLQPRTLRTIVHVLANHLMSRKDFTRTSCSTMAKDVFSKYSASFAIKDADGNLLSDGFSSFLASLYERINFIKPSDLKKRRGAKRQLIEDDEDGNFGHEVNPKYDSYGCVAWQPAIPEGETREGQVRMRQRAALEESPDAVTELLEKTYWLQRTEINKRKANLEEVLILWPALKQTPFFLGHCSKLLGKECRACWYDVLQSQGHNLFKYFEDFATSTKETNHNRDQLHSLRQLAENGKAALTETRSRTPLLIAMFMMALSYFSDKRDSIIQLVDIDTPAEDIPSVERPILIVQGHSLFDEGAQVWIACEGKKILHPTSLIEGYMLHFLSFYAFNYNYPEHGRKYMEFIQRFFFKINPSSGHKRGPKSQRSDLLDPHVKKLITSFSTFQQRLTRLLG